MNDNERTKQFLDGQTLMVLAVVLPDGSPWALPVKIQKREGNVFEWDSSLEAVHSQALATNPDMAVTIFDKKADSQLGFYAKGQGEMVEQNGAFGRYRFAAQSCWINDETFVKRAVTLV